nr:o-glycoside alpha-1,2-mannosyltransferase like 4 [Quercus suber]
MLPRLRRALRHHATHFTFLLVLTIATLFEISWHNHAYDVKRPLHNLDKPFREGTCSFTQQDHTVQQNAAIVMLARNKDKRDAVQAIRTLEQRFNRRHQYPIIFLNNEPWSSSFINALSGEVSGDVRFETIPSYMWGFREGATEDEKARARDNMVKMDNKGIPHAGQEQYHNMCRFHSGFFYDHPALEKYDWYWRVEPDARFTCDIPYDPFAEMIANNKTYGYTMALWEIGSTAPTLFRTVDEYRLARQISASSLWTALHEGSWAPYPLRHTVMPLFPSRTGKGDRWNFCHYWSNFEIADLAFYRSRAYRDLFAHLDATGGFHLERWGDAAVHSLALGLLVDPEKLHYFEDIGYKHGVFQHCPADTGGCKCDCDPNKGTDSAAQEMP